MTGRPVRTAVVASDDTIRQTIAECGPEAVEGFCDLGEHRVRGRQALIRLLGPSAEPRA